MSEPLTVQNGVKVSMEYSLKVDGKVIDASKPGQPLQFIQGKGQIIRGLESELVDMMVGESKEVVVSPELGYGRYEPQYDIRIPRNRLPPGLELKAGTTIQFPAPNGQFLPTAVVEVSDETVRLDFNHPLAGKTLHFQVKIVGLG